MQIHEIEFDCWINNKYFIDSNNCT